MTTASDRAAPRRVIRRALALGVLGAAVLAAPASALQLGPEAPHSPNTEDISTAYVVMIVVTLVVLLAVNAALLIALLRFRARRGRAPARITAGRGALTRVAGGLGVLAVAIFVFGVVISDSARTVAAPDEASETSAGLLAQVPVKDIPATPEEPAAAAADEAPGQAPESGQLGGAAGLIEIDAIAQQWLWRFEYPSEREDIATLFTYGELVVPVDTTVVLNLTSTDVIHSWWVPALTGQVQAIPGTIAQTWFKADEVGSYDGAGTVFNGTLYPALTARVRVVEQAEYDAYLENLATDLQEAQEIVRDEVAASATEEIEKEGAP
jgi:cytochrome c oxidase subunit II